jgi:aminoglycoside phosphotransferase (APT) family kinase protein
MSRKRKGASPREGRARLLDEPEPDGEEWVDWCGHLMWVAGWTEGGAPYGLTYGEWREGQLAMSAGAGWARARNVLEDLARLQSAAGAEIDVGRVVYIDSGLSRDAYGAALTVTPDEAQISDTYAVLLPRKDARSDLPISTRRELRLLAALGRASMPFRVPRPLGALPEHHGIALACTWIRGVPLDLRAGRQPSLRPWEVIGSLAAGVHAVDTAVLPAIVGGHQTRREHALAELATLEEVPGPEAEDARAWALEHLPPPEPAALVHGDLLGQNVLIDPGATPPFAVIDWEHATRGDPAYDLAIVTRGARQPFQIAGGLERLLEAYAENTDTKVTRDHVRLYELVLAGKWHLEALARRAGEGPAPEESRARLRRILRMATSSTPPG